MISKIKGLVIKAKNINENDKYLTVLCEEYGKITFKASGVRNFKSKNMVSAQPFAYSEFTLFKTPNFIRMNEAQMIEGFYGIRQNLASLALAVYLSDIASVLCVAESMDEGGMLRLLLNALYVISNEKMPNRTTKAVFELRSLTKSGFMPNLEECEICHCKNFGGDAIFFDVVGGNLVCGHCLGEPDQKRLTRISGDVLDVLRFVSSVRDERLFSFVLREDLANEFSNVCEKYLLCQLGINIDSLKYYKNYEK